MVSVALFVLGLKQNLEKRKRSKTSSRRSSDSRGRTGHDRVVWGPPRADDVRHL